MHTHIGIRHLLYLQQTYHILLLTQILILLELKQEYYLHKLEAIEPAHKRPLNDEQKECPSLR